MGRYGVLDSHEWKCRSGREGVTVSVQGGGRGIGVHLETRIDNRH